MRGNGHKPGSSADVGAFGTALRLHRRRRELSQEDLADATHGGVATRTISDLERGWRGGRGRRPSGCSRRRWA
jgi:transcriptional regulator with XRE-family HTH domain